MRYSAQSRLWDRRDTERKESDMTSSTTLEKQRNAWARRRVAQLVARLIRLMRSGVML
jgi:hypothetical protein